MKAIFAEEDCSQPIALRSHPKMKLLEWISHQAQPSLSTEKVIVIWKQDICFCHEMSHKFPST